MTRREQTIALYQEGLAVAEVARRMGFSETTTRIYLKKSNIKPENRVLSYFWDEFTTKVKAVHGERYQYSKESYQGAGKKMDVTCSTHGVFQITPQSHLRGAGCPSCKRLTREEFLERVKKDGYEYPELTEFLGKAEKVLVTCVRRTLSASTGLRIGRASSRSSCQELTEPKSSWPSWPGSCGSTTPGTPTIRWRSPSAACRGAACRLRR